MIIQQAMERQHSSALQSQLTRTTRNSANDHASTLCKPNALDIDDDLAT
jgi:hypothetical protein